MVLSLFVLKYYPIAPGRINAKITVKLIIEIDIIIWANVYVFKPPFTLNPDKLDTTQNPLSFTCPTPVSYTHLDDPSAPAKFYLNSAPAHRTCPTVLIKPEGTPEDGVVIVKDCNKVELGSLESANHRTICKYILPGQVESCQLEMGMTKLEPGSVWNTMPCHTHDRRMEVYLYFDMPEDALVMHYMGEPTETRHIVMRNEQAVISPSWSIHSGCGTQAYTFIWGMVGGNQDFDDMDNCDMKDLM